MTDWRLIRNTTNYEVSREGQVRNRKTGRVLRPTNARYRMVSLGRDVRALVHRLVADAFCEKPPLATQVNHKNGDRHDNRAENLEWVTAEENNIHARRVLHRCRGEDHGLSRLSWRDVSEIRLWSQNGYSVKSLAAEFGVSDTTIRSILARRTWNVPPEIIHALQERRKREKERA